MWKSRLCHNYKWHSLTPVRQTEDNLLFFHKKCKMHSKAWNSVGKSFAQISTKGRSGYKNQNLQNSCFGAKLESKIGPNRIQVCPLKLNHKDGLWFYSLHWNIDSTIRACSGCSLLRRTLVICILQYKGYFSSVKTAPWKLKLFNRNHFWKF